jgi:ATP-dependent DNA helicase RecG|tara:strand:- start:25430 stop:27520 length:2091 start_codon:yes stop_codon:yes gene_type:complete
VTTNSLKSPIENIKGVGPKIKEQLEKLGIKYVEDALFMLPRNYENRTKLTLIKDIIPGQAFQIEGEIIESKIYFPGRRSFYAKITDGTGYLQIRLFFFSQAQAKSFEKGLSVRIYGVIRNSGNKLEVIHPSYKVFNSKFRPPLDDTLTPIYSIGSNKITQYRLRTVISNCLKKIDESNLEEEEIDNIFSKNKISNLNIKEALKIIHNPSVEDDILKIKNFEHPAQKRLIIEELVTNLIGVKISTDKIDKMIAPEIDSSSETLKEFKNKLPFSLTHAQDKVITEILNDLKQAKPMRRLVQGDVGSGKTVVAAGTMLACAKKNLQSVLLCPTEVLAEQHFKNFLNWFAKENIKIELLTGKTKKKEWETINKNLKSGETKILIGTHAIFQDRVSMKNLSLVVVDEQQRFGVKQRYEMLQKTKANLLPHQLFMTATPIPRTLAMTIFADLSVSKIDEMPPGRNPVITSVMSNDRRDDLIERLEIICKDGNQAFWLCTMIEESESLDVQAAESAKEWIENKSKNLKIGLVHSKLNKLEKDLAIESFRKGETNVLVCTTVIEVGMDVPNASLMIIENAERLGLSQLHQLRGRVGRGPNMNAHCVLLYQGSLGEIAEARMAAMKKTNDGFEISEIDMHLRGSGEILGTKQSGGMELKIADLIRDAHLLEKAQELANIISAQPIEIDILMSRWVGKKQNLIAAQ